MSLSGLGKMEAQRKSWGFDLNAPTANLEAGTMRTKAKSNRDKSNRWQKDLITGIDDRTAVICVVGLGYVGLPLAALFARKFRVVGYDTNEKIIDNLRKGISHVDDVPDSAIKRIAGNHFLASSDETQIAQCDLIVITVPTPLMEGKEPDLSHIERAGQTIAKYLRRGQFVILESTTYPGTTRDVLVPTLEKSGLQAGIDFGVAYSPERIDPGNAKFGIANTPKIVGGISPSNTDVAARLYGTIVEQVVRVKSCEVAEAAKMLENIFRAVNIALINEFSLILDRMNINTWEVVEAASSKPYGFMTFYPGPGIGGHCIPLDPFYMSYRAKQFGMNARFIELSGEVNDFMKYHAVKLVKQGLARAGKELRHTTIAVLGVSYKRDQRDTRESPAKKIIEEISAQGAAVRIFDPLALRIETKAGLFESEPTLRDTIAGSDAVILLTNHSAFRKLETTNFPKWMNPHPVIIDTRNILSSWPTEVVYVGLGKGGVQEG